MNQTNSYTGALVSRTRDPDTGAYKAIRPRIVRFGGMLAAAFFTAAVPSNVLADAPDATLASALDNYRVEWETYVEGIRGVVSGRQGWERVAGGKDGVDSLRTAEVNGKSDIGRNESAVLETEVTGPAQVVFYWKAKPAEGDALVFQFERRSCSEKTPSEGGGQGSRIVYEDAKRGWKRIERKLEEKNVVYCLSWSYEKDGSDPSGGAAWIDSFVVSGERYERIEPEIPSGKSDGEYVVLSWQTVPGRCYQLWYVDLDDGVKKTASGPMEAEGVRMVHDERKRLYEQRKDTYEVRLLEPPSIVMMPPQQEMDVVEGDDLRIAYEAEGSGDISWDWTFNADPLLDSPLPDVEIRHGEGSVELHIRKIIEAHEGTYRVTARSPQGSRCPQGWGGESPPGVQVRVFQPPEVGDMRFTMRMDIKAEQEQVSDDPVRVGLGEAFCIVAGRVGGSEPVNVVWQKRSSAADDVWVNLDETDRRLCRKQADADDKGTYRLAARNEWTNNDFVFGPEVDVRVLHPAQTMHLFCTEPIELFENDRIDLTVRPTGTKPFEYRWYRNEEILGESTAVLALSTETASKDGGYDEYIVQVKGLTGPWSQATPVRVAVQKLDPHMISDLGIRLLPVRGGKFVMGTDQRTAEDNEGPQREVVLRRSFWMGRTEISNEQWHSVMGGEAGARSRGDLPAVVSHDEAVGFAEALTMREREHGRLPAGWAYVLPTEAQWERAARSMSPTADCAAADADSGVLQPVDPAGASDGNFQWLLGNVWEWTADWYRQRYDPNDTMDPKGPDSGTRRTLRGGGNDMNLCALTPTTRYGAAPNRRGGTFGFRIALDRPVVPARYVVDALRCPDKSAGMSQ